MIKLARTAEETGWNGIFLWDHIPTEASMPAFDPWLLLTLIAANTETIQLGTTVTPLARRRPQKIAKEVATLDHVSGGRVILGVGLGGEKEYVAYGEPYKPRRVGEKLDECLDIIQQLWTGEPVDYQGKHYHVKAQHAPTPVQSQIPIWVGGEWPNKPPFRRAARYHGVFPLKARPRDWEDSLVEEDYVDILNYISRKGGDLENYDVVKSVYSESDSEKNLWMQAYVDVGVNYLLDCLDPWRGNEKSLLEVVERGPPHF